MVKYIIEGGINFYEELYKSLDTNEANETNHQDETNNVCQITGLPLDDKYVTLECSHKFNYAPLYTEICKQKYVFKTYNVSSLTNSEFQKFKDADKDYYIKCPYCRNIQFTLLTFYPDEKYELKYGINSLEKNENDNNYLIKIPQDFVHKYSAYGYTFQKGACCNTIIGMKNDIPIYCQTSYTSLVPEMNKTFCVGHIRAALKQYKMKKKELEKQEKQEKKLLEKDQKKLKKEQQKLERTLQKMMKKEEKEQEKIDKKKKLTVKNIIVSQTISIGDFNEPTEVISDKCSAILKSGIKKGQQCGSIIKQDGFCLRHCVIIKEAKPEINSSSELNNIL